MNLWGIFGDWFGNVWLDKGRNSVIGDHCHKLICFMVIKCTAPYTKPSSVLEIEQDIEIHM